MNASTIRKISQDNIAAHESLFRDRILPRMVQEAKNGRFEATFDEDIELIDGLKAYLVSLGYSVIITNKKAIINWSL